MSIRVDVDKVRDSLRSDRLTPQQILDISSLLIEVRNLRERMTAAEETIAQVLEDGDGKCPACRLLLPNHDPGCALPQWAMLAAIDQYTEVHS